MNQERKAAGYNEPDGRKARHRHFDTDRGIRVAIRAITKLIEEE